MKLKLLIGLLIILGTSPIRAQVKPSAEVKNDSAEEIKALTRSFAKALVERDVKTLDMILSDDYVISGMSKAEWLVLLNHLDVTYTSYEREVVRIQDHGDTIISFARNEVSGKYPGSQFSSAFNSMDVWIRKNGQWRCVATMSDQIKNTDKDKEEKMVRFGPDVKYSLVVYFKKKVTEQQIESFLAQNIHQASADGKGHSFRTGICEYLRLWPLHDHEAFAIQICEGAVPYERQNVKARLRTSSVVYRVLENVAPADVKAFK